MKPKKKGNHQQNNKCGENRKFFLKILKKLLKTPLKLGLAMV